MIIAKVSCLNQDDRYFELEQGSHTVGSDIGCDVVLFYPSVAPRHFIFYVDDKNVECVLCEGANGQFRRLVKSDIEICKVGERYSWYGGDIFIIDDVHIELQGLNIEAMVKVKPTTVIFQPIYWALYTLIALIFSAIFIYLSFANESNGPANASVSHTPLVVEKQIAPQAPMISPSPGSGKADIKTIRQRLLDQNINVERITSQDGQKYITIRVANNKEKSVIEKQLKQIDDTLMPNFIIDEDLKQAAEIILSHLPGELKITNIHNGLLKISSSTEKINKDNLTNTLKNDVPGIKNVIFNIDKSSNIRHIKDKVAGVWLGKFPYLVLRDEKIIRPGEDIMDGIKLIKIQSHFIIVEIDKSQQKVAI